MSLAILFHFLCAQHFSGINISIIRSLRLFCWITTLVVFFLVRCVLEFRCGWVGVVSVLQASALLLFKFRCNIFIGVRIIKEMTGSVASGTSCIVVSMMHGHTNTKSLSLSLLQLYRNIFINLVALFIVGKRYLEIKSWLSISYNQ